MKRFPSIEWFRDLKESANADQAFQKAARWFQGAIGWKIDENAYTLRISQGRVQAVEPDLKDTLFTMAGSFEEWNELLTRGTINRLFRQNRIRIEGDKVEAIRYWKVLWYLTEVARIIK